MRFPDFLRPHDIEVKDQAGKETFEIGSRPAGGERRRIVRCPGAVLHCRGEPDLHSVFALKAQTFWLSRQRQLARERRGQGDGDGDGFKHARTGRPGG